MFVPAMPAAKAKSAAPHVPMVGAGGAVLLVLMFIPMHQKSSCSISSDRLTVSDLRYIENKIYLSALEFQEACAFERCRLIAQIICRMGSFFSLRVL
jgi:hypothetical protein